MQIYSLNLLKILYYENEKRLIVFLFKPAWRATNYVGFFFPNEIPGVSIMIKLLKAFCFSLMKLHVSKFLM